jgi:hypothetical protein
MPTYALTLKSIRWHLIENLDLAQTFKIEVNKFKEGRLEGHDYIALVYYSRGNEKNVAYIKDKKK